MGTFSRPKAEQIVLFHYLMRSSFDWSQLEFADEVHWEQCLLGFNSLGQGCFSVLGASAGAVLWSSAAAPSHLSDKLSFRTDASSGKAQIKSSVHPAARIAQENTYFI